MKRLEGKNVVLGVTGGIAAYKACELASFMTQAGAAVDVVMTRAATEFVRPLSFEALTGRPVLCDLFPSTKEWAIGHVSLAERAQVVLVAPLTANTLAKIARGFADNLLTATILATKAPIVLAPAMNVGMYENPITRENLESLRSRGLRVVEPGIGRLACGATGKGRLGEKEAIIEEVLSALSPQDLRGRKVVVTAGGTREPVDPVRYLGNRSSGRMGYAIARAAHRRGASVSLISGPSALPPPPGVRWIPVETALEMGTALESAVADADALVMAAAVADYRPARPAGQKMKKDGREVRLDLVENPDLLDRTRGTFVRIGFAAETERLVDNATEKLERKNLDLVVANDVGRPGGGFDSANNQVAFVSREGVEELPLLTKEEVADRLVSRLVHLLNVRK